MVPSETRGASYALVVLGRADEWAALQELVAVRVEEDAVPGREPQPCRFGAVVDHPKQGQESCPGAVALVHRVGVECCVGPQPFVEAGKGVVAFEGPVVGQQAALFRVEQEHQPQDHGEQTAIDVVAVFPELFVQQLAARGVVGCLEAAQQLVEGVQHLHRELLADLVLVLAAVGEQGRQALFPRQGQQPALVQQQSKRGADRPARHQQHVGNIEVHPARALAVRRRDEAQGAAVEEQAGGDSRRPQQALQPAVGRGFEPAGAGGHAIEILAGLKGLNRQLPGRAAVVRVSLADREVGAQRLAVVGQVKAQILRHRSAATAGVAVGGEAPVQDRAGEGLEIGQEG